MINTLDNKKREVFENKPILSAVLSLALPSILGQLILVIYNMVDTYFIGLAADQMVDKAVGNALVAGVTICMPVYMILSAISNLFGIGAASVISRSLGKGNPERAKRASQFAFYSCLLVSAIYCLLIFIFVKPLTSVLSSGNSADVAKYAEQYILFSVVIFGVPTAINTLFSHLLRAQGKSVHASTGIAIGGVLNCVLDPLFMFVIMPKNPAVGAAVATGISNTIALLYYVVLILVEKKTLVISVKFNKKMFQNGVPLEVIKVGTPACLMTLCENISYIILDSLVGSASLDIAINDAALAGIGVAKKINMFAHCVVRGMTQGVLPLIGYNKTSGNKKRMYKTVYVSGAMSLGISLLSVLVFFLFSKELSSIFVHESMAIEKAELFLKILCVGAPFSALAYTVISFFQATGKAWRSLILVTLRKGVIDIPLMFIFFSIALSETNARGAELIVLATPLADVICFITSLILFFLYRRSTLNKTIDIQKEAILCAEK